MTYSACVMNGTFNTNANLIGLSHLGIWTAIDMLANINGLSTSGLAVKSGLDATSFNPSKRHDKYGKPRWPSTETIAKILIATNTNFSTFAKLSEEVSLKKSRHNAIK
jgi:phage repressor protein C with HTH and peptisase S24 domain